MQIINIGTPKNTHRRKAKLAVIMCVSMLLSACGGGSGDSAEDSIEPAPITPPPSTTPPASPAPDLSGQFETPEKTSRFLTIATFGPKPENVQNYIGTSASDWVLEQFDAPVSPFLSGVQEYYEMGSPQQGMIADAFDQGATTYVFWRNAVHGEDQLRQRMAYALSQITVVSNGSGGLLGILPQTVGYFQDILAEHALGNYRDLLEAVTYSPAMAEYLTYLGNEKGNASSGRVPDENYAREILQLFTIGLVQLNPDGSEIRDADGNAIETYDNNDITGLAKVFTGLNNPALRFSSGADIVRRSEQIRQAITEPLLINEEAHSSDEKTFLGLTISANTQAKTSIEMALDHIMTHPNVGPFVSKQLIQRFVTSNPSPSYIERVASAFDQGTYALPNGVVVGDSRKGDLKATISAILFDPENTLEFAMSNDTFGKVREPILRLSHFMRAFNTDMSTPEYVAQLYDTSALSTLGQHPYRSQSVFNFYRPGYKAPGTLSANEGLVAPELQILNASSIPGYINLLSHGTFQLQRETFEQFRPIFLRFSASFDATQAQQTFVPDYQEAIELTNDASALVDYLDALLTYGNLSDFTKQEIIATLNQYPRDDLQESGGRARLVGYAVLLLMSSPDYLIQR